MDILRRNTDYALRAMVNLAENSGKKPASARQIARRENISYQLACKILQKLHNAGLVESCMGPKGGFQLSKKPSRISLLQIVKAIQGPVRVNRCLLGDNACPLRPKCAVSKKLAGLQNYIDSFLGGITLEELSHNKQAVKKSKGRRK
jgi:Rrf2 family iron-sulfur cluster assembly transcriptional regulator